MKYLLIIGLMLTTLIASSQDHCKATTTKNKPCMSVIGLKDGYCNVHNPNSPKCGFITSKKTPCKIPVAKSGDRCRFHKGRV